MTVSLFSNHLFCLQRVQETCLDGTDLNGFTLRSFLCNEEGKEQELELFGRRSVVTFRVFFLKDQCFVNALLLSHIQIVWSSAFYFDEAESFKSLPHFYYHYTMGN